MRFFRHSADHGRTWSDPVKVGDGSSNNDAIVLSDGNRLIVPLLTGWTRSSEPLALIMASDDLGASWRLLSRAGALPKAPYRVARESREEFGEPHAGIVFMKPVSKPPDAEAARLAALHDKLNLRKFPGWQIRLPQSTGAADDAVQACNYRTMLTTNPANRAPVSQPANYDPYFFKTLEVFSGVKSIPNDKFGWNRPQLVGRQTPYVEADWTERQRIMDEHWEATLGFLYFLQHDPTVPAKVRDGWLEYGLAKDEFTDNGHRPYEIYVREARRITGRAIYTQHDAMVAPGLGRAPVHADSIAITDWYMDSHSCTLTRLPGSMEEGKAMLHQETFPGQLPWRCLLPQGVDNLLVPVCLSATHVAWGTVRLAIGTWCGSGSLAREVSC